MINIFLYKFTKKIMEDNNKNSYKVVLVGESGVGKTCIITQYIEEVFDDKVTTTNAATFSSKVVELENQKVKFDIWDTAGQEIYRSIGKIFYKGAKAVIFVYAITDPNSFNEIKKYWYNQIKENTPKDVNKF